MRIKGKEDKRGGRAEERGKCMTEKMERERDGEKEGRHALKASETYIFKCTNCFQEPMRTKEKHFKTT